MSVAEILDGAADRLSKPGAWQKGRYARDAEGRSALTDSPNAVCFCLTGAIAAELHMLPGAAEAWMARHAVKRLLGLRGHVHQWNDSPRRKQEEVVAKLRDAANKARAASGMPLREDSRSEAEARSAGSPTGEAGDAKGSSQ